QRPVPSHSRHASLQLTVPSLGFRDRLGQTRVGHAIEDVTDALRIVLFEHLDDLTFKLRHLVEVSFPAQTYPLPHAFAVASGNLAMTSKTLFLRQRVIRTLTHIRTTHQSWRGTASNFAL